MKVKKRGTLYVAGEGKRYFGVQRDSRLVWGSLIKLSSPTKMPNGIPPISGGVSCPFFVEELIKGLFKGQNSLKDGNTRVLFGYAFIKFDS